MALAHKIIRIAFTLLKDKVPYRDPEIDSEALLTQRNALLCLKGVEKCHALLAATQKERDQAID
ncbi:MAG: hypothetical protein LBI10_05510 [Deltaproteobacteria bacterium]|jgi:hypothetical protein|nr:hypothetical protein [Deltaproteobacteria bacterium]